jgi:predicted permease
MQDIRFALRGLRKHPGLTLAAILSLGLGIGANTTVFTWIQAFVVDPLPAVSGFDRLVEVETRGPENREWSLSYPSFRDWSQATRTVDLAVADMFQAGLQQGDGVQRVWGLAVSANYFDVLKVRPALGRGFQADEETNATPVAVLNHRFWMDRFFGDSAILGRTITVNSIPLTVIGIAPPRFGGTAVGLSFDFFFPVTLEPRLLDRPTWLDDRGSQFLEGIGRLRDGVTLTQAATEMDELARRAEEAGGSRLNRGAVVTPYGHDGAPALLGPALNALMGVTAVVLLIACANIASLLVARALARQREIGIRLALGASRARLVRQLLTESAMLALAAGIAGVGLTFWGRDLMRAFIPAGPYPIELAMSMNLKVVAFAAVLTAATTLLFGLVPALQTSRPELVPALKQGIGDAPVGRARVQSVLIVGQVALSVVSLVMAGLFVRSLGSAKEIDTGLTDPDRTLLVTTDFFLAGYRDSTGPVAVTTLLERLKRLPGVEVASTAASVPLGFSGTSSSSTRIEGYEPRVDENMSIVRNAVGAGYFAGMGTPVLRGREFVPEDRDGSLPVVVVNQAFADRYWPGLDPLGRRLDMGGGWKTVVGVVQTGKYRQLTEPPRPVVFHAVTQQYRPDLTILLRARSGSGRELSSAARAAFAEVNPNLPYLDVRTMAEHMQASLFVHRIGAWMLSGLGIVALLLSGVGIYGTLAYLVGRRTREIGVRIALGAARRDVLSLVLGRALRLTGIGLVIGLLLALGAGQLARSVLLGVSPRDPMTYANIAILLGVVAFVASWIPARRAARVNPLNALRAE